MEDKYFYMSFQKSKEVEVFHPHAKKCKYIHLKQNYKNKPYKMEVATLSFTQKRRRSSDAKNIWSIIYIPMICYVPFTVSKKGILSIHHNSFHF